MNEVDFIRARDERWRRLEALVRKADVSTNQLTGPEINELIRLYRRTCDDLAFVMTRSSNESLIDFLNDLNGQAHAAIYRNRRRGIWELINACLLEAARTVRARFVFVTLSLFVLVGSGVIAFGSLKIIPETKDYFISPSWRPNFEKWKFEDMTVYSLDESILATGGYGSHNPLVTIISSGVGASTFGIGSAVLLFQNGALIGALSKEMADVNRLGYLYAHIMPHGVTEISGIVIGDAAGFLMGWSLIRPGRRKRSEALLASSKDALTLLLVGITLMFLAAPIEGFLSFNAAVPLGFKIGFALCSFVAWMAFWTFYGRAATASENK